MNKQKPKLPSWLTNKRAWLSVAGIVVAIVLLSSPLLSAAQDDTPAPTLTPTLFEESAQQSSLSTPFELDGFWRTLAEMTWRMLWAAVRPLPKRCVVRRGNVCSVSS